MSVKQRQYWKQANRQNVEIENQTLLEQDKNLCIKDVNARVNTYCTCSQFLISPDNNSISAFISCRRRAFLLEASPRSCLSDCLNSSSSSVDPGESPMRPLNLRKARDDDLRFMLDNAAITCGSIPGLSSNLSSSSSSTSGKVSSSGRTPW